MKDPADTTLEKCSIKGVLISDHGNVRKIAALFGEPVQLRQTTHQLQTLLYAA